MKFRDQKFFFFDPAYKNLGKALDGVIMLAFVLCVWAF